MRRWVTTAVAVLGLLLGGSAVHGQTRADSAAVLLHAAEQLRLRGDVATARALLDYIERQYAGTVAAGDVARMRAAMRRMPEPERPGRTELIVWGTGYGAWLGVAVPLMFGSESPEVYGVGLLAGAPLGFLAARSYAARYQPTEGQVRAITFGGSWGTWQGFGWAEALDIGVRTHRVTLDCPPGGPCESYEYEETSAETMVAAAVVGGLVGIGTGALLARKPITAGTAATVSLGALWGSWFGFAGSYVAGLEEDELLVGTLLAGNAALLGTALAAPRWQLTESRARLISLGGLIGGLTGVGLLLIAQPDDERTAMAVPLVGSAIGLTVGALTTRDRGADGESGGGGALINREGDRWALDVPGASLGLQRTRSGVQPALHVPLLHARF